MASNAPVSPSSTASDTEFNSVFSRLDIWDRWQIISFDDINKHQYTSKDTRKYDQPNILLQNFGFRNYQALATDTLNDLVARNLNPLGVHFVVSCVKWKFHFGEELLIELDASSKLAVMGISDVMPRRRLDPLRQELRQIVSNALGESSWSTLGFGCMLLQLVEAGAWHLRDFKTNSKRPVPKQQHGPESKGWKSSAADQLANILENEHGVDLNTVSDSAKEILGRSVQDILKEIPEDLRVLHVEPVFRGDLVSKFLQRQQEMKEELMALPKEELMGGVSRAAGRRNIRSVEAMATHLVQPEVTFHGAPRNVVSNIVRYGFLKPGEAVGQTGQQLEGRFFNSWYGRGIYSSPSLDFAACYGQFDIPGGSGRLCNPTEVSGMRVIVCATIMGLPLQVTKEKAMNVLQPLHRHAQSHVSPDGMEYIVFDSAQIIPCYVLHIDDGPRWAKWENEQRRSNASLSRPDLLRGETGWDKADADCPGAKLAKKAALKASAMKYLPYGFGTAAGANFVVEDMADASDDEPEETDEFHYSRVEMGGERTADEQVSWFDEYQMQRATNWNIRF